jgi:hypothetical protein
MHNWLNVVSELDISGQFDDMLSGRRKCIIVSLDTVRRVSEELYRKFSCLEC